jgi:tetraacyldisaccharide 4'-kinase
VDILKWLLFPFSMIYFIITSIRNFCYDTGIFKSYSSRTTTICVGNLSVGGTGKSPMIEHLIYLYKEDYNIAVLSRGYKRTTSGFIEVCPEMSVEDAGDEPLQFKRKFNDIKVFVDANRKNALEQIEKNHPDVNLILLDDAYQHRRVKADINILLTTFAKPFYRDFILPVGRLRESKTGKKRADFIIVTKCPSELDSKEIENILRKINASQHQKVLFSKISYDQKLYNLTTSLELKDFDNFLLVTGIANPKPLVSFLKNQQKTFSHLKFPDHHNFTSTEIENLVSGNKPILTTEKDFTRLQRDIKENIYYLPIGVKLNKDLKSLMNIKPQ